MTKVLKTVCSDGGELNDFFLPNMMHCGLFVPGLTNLRVGEEVCIWFALKNPPVELYLRGNVYWVRHKSGPRHQRLRSGVGVGFKAGQQAQVEFLQNAIGGHDLPNWSRRPRRTPLLSPWRCGIDFSSTEKPRQAMVSDISKGGALAVAGRLPLMADDELKLIFNWHSQTTHHMRVAWIGNNDERIRLGLDRQRTNPIADREWAELLELARQSFHSQIWSRREASGSHRSPR